MEVQNQHFEHKKKQDKKTKLWGFFVKKKKNNHDIKRILKFNVRTNFLHSYRCLIFRHNIFQSVNKTQGTLKLRCGPTAKLVFLSIFFETNTMPWQVIKYIFPVKMFKLPCKNQSLIGQLNFACCIAAPRREFCMFCGYAYYQSKARPPNGKIFSSQTMMFLFSKLIHQKVKPYNFSQVAQGIAMGDLVITYFMGDVSWHAGPSIMLDIKLPHWYSLVSYYIVAYSLVNLSKFQQNYNCTTD